MEIFIFVSEQWVLISVLMGLVYFLIWSERSKGGKPITANELVAMMNADTAVLVDVRPASEFQSGHIHGAINIPHNKVDGRIGELEKSRSKILVMADHMGQHAGSDGRKFSKEGYNVRRLSGGMGEWQAQSMPVVRD